MKFVEYADEDMMMIDVANQIAGELTASLMTADEVLLAVPGGTTPAPMFDSLCAANIEWERVVVVPTDERWVPEESSRSNARLIREHLLKGAAEKARFLSLYTGAVKPEDAFGALSETIEPMLPITVAVLGMGNDMHTASLFPDMPDLDKLLDDDAPPVMAARPPSADEPRITLTGPTLAGALRKHVLIKGPDKREALDRAVKIDDPLKAPIVAVLDGATVHWAP